MSATPTSNGRQGPSDGRTSAFSPTYSADERSSFDTNYRSGRNGGNGGVTGTANALGTYHNNGSRDSWDSRSASDFYSEDDSDNSEGYADAAGHLMEAAQRSGAPRTAFLRSADGGSNNNNNSVGHRSASSPASRLPSTGRRGTTNSAGANRMSLMDTPLSYFHRHSTGTFSIRNEFRCYASHLCHLFRAIEEDRLPWRADFADVHKMRFPHKLKEIAGRLNLNIPYYSANYIEVFYVVTMPFLLFYNTPFFLVTLLTMVLIHSVTLRRKNTRVYGESVTVLGWSISYRNLAHILLFAFVVLFMFFNGLKTMLWVFALNLSVIVPHAMIRKPTYFDDEDLEKCRPKLGQYAIVLLLLALNYLEGDVSDNDETMSRRLIEQEKKRLAAVLEKREGKD
jgi:PRA1 family protein 1